MQEYGAPSIFGCLVDGRVVGAVIVRVWPNNPHEGDVHIVASRRRMTDYETVTTFLSFLKARAQLMNLKRWRVVVEPDNVVVTESLKHIGFSDKGVSPFPILGVARILTREVN